jgi:hypothetical protein
MDFKKKAEAIERNLNDRPERGHAYSFELIAVIEQALKEAWNEAIDKTKEACHEVRATVEGQPDMDYAGGINDACAMVWNKIRELKVGKV